MGTARDTVLASKAADAGPFPCVVTARMVRLYSVSGERLRRVNSACVLPVVYHVPVPIRYS